MESTEHILLSVIIPVYNAETYISCCLESLIKQGMNEHNYEILCIDDGSKDNSEKTISEYCKKYNYIKYLYKENGGVSSARNYGIEKSCGEFITFVDADDFVREGTYSILIDAMISNKVDVLELGHKCVFDHKVPVENDEISTYITDIKTKETPCNSWKLIIRRNVLADNSIIFPLNVKIGEDHAFNIILYSILDGSKMLKCDQRCLYYFIHNDSTVRTFDVGSEEFSMNRIEDKAKIVEFCRGFISKNPKLQKNHSLRKYIGRSQVSIAVQLLFLPKEKTLKMLKECKSRSLYPYNPFLCLEGYDFYIPRNNKAKEIKKMIKSFFTNTAHNIMRLGLSLEIVFRIVNCLNLFRKKERN